MEALLGAVRSPGCASVDDLQLHLRQLLASKVSPTKAEHISDTTELRTTAVFNLTLSETENHALDTVASSLGPSANGISPAQPLEGGQFLRQVGASVTLVNQPHDDPVLQRAVSKHLIGALGQVDGCTWAVRSMSRDAQGWIFIYNCRDSMQTWMRQNAKNKARTVVGESSGKDGQDPINLARPAFDCRGSVTISFIKANKAISVKYDHTPFHKTVAQLMEIFAPPPPPVVAKPPAEKGVGSAKKKSNKRKRDSQAAAVADDGSVVENNGETGTPSANATPKKRAPPKKKRKSAAVEGEATEQTMQNGAESVLSEATPAQSTTAPNAATNLNLPPGEEERRRTVATKMLSDQGINPQSLSPDQFNIFANQAPELQKESLAMLVKYGAERLQIVHPANAVQPSPAPTTPARPAADATTAATAAAAAISQTPDAATANNAADSAKATPASSRKRQRAPRLTRGKCQGCKMRKLKCGKQKPTCAECEEAGNPCEYALQKPQAKQKDAAVDDDDGNDAEGEEEGDANETTQLEDTSYVDTTRAEVTTTELAPVPAAESANQFANADYSWDHTNPPENAYSSATGHDHSHDASTHTQYPDPSSHSTLPELTDTSYPLPPTTTVGHQVSSATAANNDYWNADMGDGRHEDASVNSWATSAPQTSTARTPSYKQQHSSRTKSSRSAKSRNAAETTQTHEGMQQATALAHEGARKNQHSPAVRKSPFQASSSLSGTRSKRGQKGQTQSPLSNPSTTARATTTRTSLPDTMPFSSASNPSSTTAATSYSPYSREDTTATTQSQTQSNSGYDSYGGQSGSGSSNSYLYQNQYNSQPAETTSGTYGRSSVQANSSAHRTSTPSNWVSGGRNAPSYASSTTANNLGSGNNSSSYNMPSTATTQPQHSMHTRQRSSGGLGQSQTRSSASYDNHQQSQQANAYSLRPTATQQSGLSHNYNMMHQNLQLGRRQQQQQQQQQDWYGGYNNNGSGSKAAKTNATSSFSLGSQGGGAGHHGGYDQSQQRQTRSLNNNSLHGHSAYGMDAGDQALYDLLRGSQQ